MNKRLLIANRGEIACRIIRSARALGWHTTAVYSDADADALHVELADAAYRIGPAPAGESYLVQSAILDAARQAGAGFIHPGYGFLAENASFAAACAENGFVFVGPPVAAIEAMGDKSAAKNRMEAAGVPCLPGYHEDDQSDTALLAAAESIGWPVLLKPSAGGGGKGMHVVSSAAEFPALLETARREAAGAFGDDRMLIEKYLERARHVEIQLFSDSHDNHVYLFERDCSVQRRHQKIIEEAPAPGVDEGLRRQMGEAAVQAAAAISYLGAGTVEFLLAPDGAFYFMEMNTRLQVEHPVTEMITGQDLVAWQLAVAAGEPLPKNQDELTISGHSIEARLYAEDPARNFLPSIGRFENALFPDAAAGIRIDSAVRPGCPGEIAPYYDPMIAKVITHGRNREEALARLASALSEIHLPGIITNAGFARAVIVHPAFAEGELSTRFLEDHEPNAAVTAESLAQAHVIAALRHAAYLQALETAEAQRPAHQRSPWSTQSGWRLNASASMVVEIDNEGERNRIELEPVAGHSAATYGFRVCSSTGAMSGHVTGDQVTLIDGSCQQRFRAICECKGITVFLATGPLQIPIWSPSLLHAHEEAEGACHAPMSGTIIQVLVEKGATVAKGDSLVIMEAMKMEHTLRAPEDAEVSSILCKVGEMVQEGQTLLELEESE